MNAITKLYKDTAPSSWIGHDMLKDDKWIYHLTSNEIKELNEVVSQIIQQGAQLEELDIEDYEVPLLKNRAKSFKDELFNGRGFQMVRGMPIDSYTYEEAATAYWIFGLCFGEPLSQNGKGHLLGHVANLGLNYSDPEVRGYQTSARLSFHTDPGDIVGLLCWRGALKGGLSSLVSSSSVWNRLVQQYPHHAKTLTQPYFYTRWGEVPKGKLPYDGAPVFSSRAGRIFSYYVRSAIDKAQLLNEVPRLTSDQAAALDALEEIIADPLLPLDMELKPGDMQFVCNHWIFHSRTAYEDSPELEYRRHLLRLWLACPDGPPLPGHMLERWGRTESGRQDGIRVPGVPLTASLQP